MPTPNTFKKMAKWLKPRRLFLWIGLFFGLTLMIIPNVIVFMKKGQEFPNISTAFGVGLLVIVWGLICAESWFSEKPQGKISKKLQSFFPKTYELGRIISQWCASIFLIMWLWTGVLMTVLILIKN